MNSKVRRSRAAFAVLVALVVIAPVVAGAGLVAAQEGDDQHTGTNATDAPETKGYTVAELEENGPLPSSDADPSIRQFGDYGSFWLVHTPVRALANPEVRGDRAYVSPTTTVERDHVHIGAFRGWNSEQMNLRVHVVVWDIEEVTRRINGTNQTVEKPANVTEQTQNVTLPPGGKPEMRVSLPEHHGEPKFVTMWVEGEEETLRWTFRYSTSKAAQSIPLATQGGLVMWGFVWVGLPFLGVSAGMIYVNKHALKKAVRVPDAALAELVFLVLVVAFFAGFVFYHGTLETLAVAPWSVGAVGGLLVGVMYLFAFGQGENKALALQLSEKDSRVRNDGSGIIRANTRTFSLHERDDGTLVVTRDGWLAFIARSWPFRNVTAEVEFDGEFDGTPETRLKGDEESEFSDVFLLDPDTEEPVEHETEGWTFSFPSLVSWPKDEDGDRAPLPSVAWGPLVAVLAACAVAYYAAVGLWQNTALAAVGVCLVLLVVVTTPLPATVRLHLGPFQYASALLNLIEHRELYDETADAEHFQAQYHKERAKSDAKRKRDREREDKTVLEELSRELAGTTDRDRDGDRGDQRDAILDEPEEVSADD